MASSLSERDFKTQGDGLLTFDSKTGREWLDLSYTRGKSSYGVDLALKPGDDLGGFVHASDKDISGFLSNGGINTSTIHGLSYGWRAVAWPTSSIVHPSDLTGEWSDSAYEVTESTENHTTLTVIMTSPTNKSNYPESYVSAVSTIFSLLDTPTDITPENWHLYGTSSDDHTYVLEMSHKSLLGVGIGTEDLVFNNSSTPYFLYRPTWNSDTINNDTINNDTINIAPTSITLSNNSINESNPVAVIGDLKVVDPDAKFREHILSLSGQDADLFYIKPPHEWLGYPFTRLVMKSSSSVDYETKSKYDVTVTATDSGGLSKSHSFTINVTPTPPPNTSLNLSERDFKTLGDRLLTFDSKTGREWLDLSYTRGKSVVELSYALKPNDDLGGFIHASSTDVLELLSNGGFDSSSITGVRYALGGPVGDQHATHPHNDYLKDTYDLVDSSPSIEWMSATRTSPSDKLSYPESYVSSVSAIFGLLDTPTGITQYKWHLYGTTSDDHTYVLELSRGTQAAIGVGIGTESFVIGNSDTPYFLYRPEVTTTNSTPVVISLESLILYENVPNSIVGY
jgi:hypothetical protein